MTLMAQLEVVEGRMNDAFRQHRFDTLGQLMSERWALISKARMTPEHDAVRDFAVEKSEQWIKRLNDGLDENRCNQRRAQARNRAMKRTPSSGHLLKRIL